MSRAASEEFGSWLITWMERLLGCGPCDLLEKLKKSVTKDTVVLVGRTCGKVEKGGNANGKWDLFKGKPIGNFEIW